MKFDVCIIGAGASGMALGQKLFESGKKVCILSAGSTLNNKELCAALVPCIFSNTRAVGAVFSEEGVKSVCTDNELVIEADNFVLASGRFISRGLESTMDTVFEPVFGADVEYSAQRNVDDFFAPQPFESFGVKTDDKGRCLKDGKALSNLFAVGEILCGKQDITKTVERVCKNIR